MIKIKISKEFLYDFYINQNMSCENIAQKLNCHFSTIARRLKKYNILTQRNKSIKEKFWEKVTICAQTDVCWNWKASKYPNGYGQ